MSSLPVAAKNIFLNFIFYKFLWNESDNFSEKCSLSIGFQVNKKTYDVLGMQVVLFNCEQIAATLSKAHG
jgi:hypothetical protein